MSYPFSRVVLSLGKSKIKYRLLSLLEGSLFLGPGLILDMIGTEYFSSNVMHANLAVCGHMFDNVLPSKTVFCHCKGRIETQSEILAPVQRLHLNHY